MKKTKQKPEYEKAILSAKKQFIKIAGKEAWERESGFALGNYFNLVIRTLKRYDAPNSSSLTPMQSCEPESIRQSMLNIAYTGVTLNSVFSESYLFARDGKCFLDFSYRGLIKIATSEGAIVSLSAGVVYSWDEFYCEQGTNSHIRHIPNLLPPRSSKEVAQMDNTLYPSVDPEDLARNPKRIWEYLKCAYSIATLPNGSQAFIVLPKWKLIKTWNETGAKSNPINNLWPEEWIRKTAIRYHSKTLPHAKRLVTAVSVLNEHEGVKKSKTQSRLMKRIKK